MMLNFRAKFLLVFSIKGNFANFYEAANSPRMYKSKAPDCQKLDKFKKITSKKITNNRFDASLG
jgi:hypothetical protein